MKNKLPDIIEHVGRNQYPNESAGRKRDTLALNFLEPIIYDEAAGTETQLKTEMTARKESKKEADYTAKVSRLSEVETKPIAWLWFNYFALGMLTMISGLPGAGKGFIVAYIISCITRGFPFPDGFTPPKGNVWKVWGKFDKTGRNAARRGSRLLRLDSFANGRIGAADPVRSGQTANGQVTPKTEIVESVSFAQRGFTGTKEFI